MNIKRILAMVLLLVTGMSGAFGINWVHPDFEDFAVTSVGIYTNCYGQRTARVVRESRYGRYENMYGKRFDIELDYYARFTAPLTTPEYPIDPPKDSEVTTELEKQIGEYLDKAAYTSAVIEGFNGETLEDLLAYAAQQDIDAVLLVRYYTITSFSPHDKASPTFTQGTSGLGVSPALELYDTRTGVRLWYSAYHSYHPDDTISFYFDRYQDFVRTVFVPGDNPYREAVRRIVHYTLDSSPSTFYNDEPLPIALDNTERKQSTVRAAKRRYFLSDAWPMYAKTYGAMAINYSFDYIGSLDLEHSVDDGADEVFTAGNVLGHRVSLIPFIYGRKNLFFQPARIEYRLMTFQNDGMALLMGAGVSTLLEYHFRLHDYNTIYLGLGLSASMVPGGEYRVPEESYNDNGLIISPQIYAGIVFNKPKPGGWYVLFTQPAGMSTKKLFIRIEPRGIGNGPTVSIGGGFQLRNTATRKILFSNGASRVINPHNRHIYEEDMD